MSEQPKYRRDIYLLRFQPRRALAVHAGRQIDFLGRPEIRSACRNHYVSPEYESAGVLAPTTKVTCKECLRRLDRPLTRSQIMAALIERRAAETLSGAGR